MNDLLRLGVDGMLGVTVNSEPRIPCYLFVSRPVLQVSF